MSRDPGELIAEAEALAADGVREVTLLGQNVNSYGRDLPREPRIGFAELLARVDAVEGIERIRYTSPHPKDMKEDVIRAHAELPALCEHIHLPLQSGSSAVLKRMRRTYDRERYMDRVALIREHVPDCAITTDIIVGFPGETEADFAQTLEVVEEVGYDGAFTFVFSPRRETEAATIDEQVPHPVKVERMERLVEAGPAARHRTGPALRRPRDGGAGRRARAAPTETRLRGRTRHNKAVNFEGVAEPGEFVEVEIDARYLADAERGLGASRSLNSFERSSRYSGPTGVGKTGVAIALAEQLRERGEDPVAISCDALQVYEGLGDSDRRRHARSEQARLEHRLIGFVPVTEPFSVGDYMRLAHREVDAALAAGRRPIVVGGTASTCGRRSPSSRWSRLRPTPRTPSSGRRRPGTRRRSSASTWTAARSTSGSTPAPRRSSPPARSRRCAGPRRRARRAPPARRSASTSCSAATSS